MFNRNMNRRTFLKSSAIPIAVHMGMGSVFNRCSGPSVTGLDRFPDPPVTARPFVRWWWNGNKVTEREILRELDLLKAAGIGGVEINPILFPNPEDHLNIPALEWLSPEWIRLVKIAVQGCKDRDMIADIIVGSGWPFGGKFLKPEEQTKILSLVTRNVKGPQTIRVNREELLREADLAVHSKNENIIKSIKFTRLVPAEMSSFDPGTDFSDQWKDGILDIKVPAGEYVLYFLVLQIGFQSVINGAPGADGPVVDHYKKSAVERYLNRMSDAMVPVMGELGAAFRAMFCDSLELEGANWCDDMLEEFKERRGYDLHPYLPFILFKTGHMGNVVKGEFGAKLSETVKGLIQRVRYDFYITRLELFHERFIQTFQQWCHQHNVQARVQAYGRGYHPLEASTAIDIPECETWLRPNTGSSDYRAYSVINKFVASGARLANKQLVSCEEITNTSFVFFATLEMIKIAGDESNLSGVNHSVLHGFNYSPLEAQFPGWVRYGTFFNERNPWWPFLRNWTDYKARVSYVLQNAEPKANIAVIHPLADIWQQYGLQRQPFPKTNYPSYQYDLWEAIHQNGNNCDYLSENIIKDSEIENGKLLYNKRKYNVLILMQVETLQPETAQKMKRFAEKGGTIVFIKTAPEKSPGFLNVDKGDSIVKNSMQIILGKYPERCAVVSEPSADLMQWYQGIQKRFNLVPDVTMQPCHSFVSQICLKKDDLDIYFFVNSSKEKAFRFTATFPIANKTPWIWNPETGEKTVYPYSDKQNVLDIRLQPAGSLLLVFDPVSGQKKTEQKSYRESAFNLQGEWQVKFEHINGQKFQKNMNKLTDLKASPDLRDFAGNAIYSKRVDIDQPSEFQYLNLGTVYGISRLKINDKDLGCHWYGEHVYPIKDVLKSGQNTIEICVTTVMGNYCKSLTDNPVTQRWTRGNDYQSTGLIGPVKFI